MEKFGLYGVIGRRDEIMDMDYMIVSSKDYDRFFRDADKYEYEVGQYNAFFSENKMVREFVPDKIKTTGPKIRIYRIVK